MSGKALPILLRFRITELAWRAPGVPQDWGLRMNPSA